MRSLILFGIGYTLIFWGFTLFWGGPPYYAGGQKTGSWPFLYATLKLGPPPTEIKGSSYVTNPGNPYTPTVEL